MNYPPLTIGIITYKRLEPLCQVIAAYDAYLNYPRESLNWIVSDDGSGTKYRDHVLNTFPHLKIKWFSGDRLGMGGNWNRMIHEAEELGDLTLCVQDDWRLTEPLDLTIAVKFLEYNSHYGMIRYPKLTGHNGLPVVMQEWDTRQAGLDYHHGENEYVLHMLPFCEVLYPF